MWFFQLVIENIAAVKSKKLKVFDSKICFAQLTGHFLFDENGIKWLW